MTAKVYTKRTRNDDTELTYTMLGMNMDTDTNTNTTGRDTTKNYHHVKTVCGLGRLGKDGESETT